ncbi:hypothetical protein KQI77_02595 [Clostridium sp. MSJ-8]|uniref:hypothetical protein n=1 Tax=Clostridium sp. MSJ-8 TaxID=2841510 RepID=UPI001C0F01AC|nr:hypothetical protein [Clostridium sp. MSJ-8]MBU5487051.1 hypothetical protein [Clostridium sp. MSJ-8]
MNSCKQLMKKRKKIIRTNIALAVVLVVFLALCFWNLIFSIPFIITALIIANNENRISRVDEEIGQIEVKREDDSYYNN